MSVYFIIFATINGLLSHYSMKKSIIKSIILIFALFSTFQIKAIEIFDMSEPSRFFSLSARFAINSSNRTFPSGYFNKWNNNSWGTGIDVGALANIHIKEFLTIQPGLFYESRSGNFAYLTGYLDFAGKEQEHYEMGHYNSYNFTIPVVGVVKYQLLENVEVMAELGPYFQVRLKETGQKNIQILHREPLTNDYSVYKASSKGYDVGLKMGGGLRFFDHYYVGVHYLAGLCNAWTRPSGGKNKSWQFSVGYDF